MVPLARMHLRATSGALRGRDFPFTGAPLVIGRAATCAISIPNHGVSRVHARIEYTDGDYWLIPEKTVNGTRVNGVLVHESRRLVEGDQVGVEDCTFVVTLRGPDIAGEDPVAAPPASSNVVVSGELHPVRYSAPTIATVAAPPRYSEPAIMQTPYPAPPAMPGFGAYYQPYPYAPQPPAAPRWPMIAAIAFGAIGLIVGIVLVTVRLVEPKPAIVAAPPVTPMPVVVATPPAPTAAPTAPPVVATPAPAPPKPAPVHGTLVIDAQPIAANAHGTVVDVVADASAVDAGAVIAHVRLDSAAYEQAYAKLAALQRKYGNSPDYADFIAQARQDFAAAARRREVQPVTAAKRGTLAHVAVKAGSEVAPHQVIAELVAARLTVPVAAVDGSGSHCVAHVGDEQLAGTLLEVGTLERTLELDAKPTHGAGDVGEVHVHCTE